MGTGFFNSAESVVTYAATAVELGLLVRLAWLGLIREFKCFWMFLAYDAVLTVALSRWDHHSNSYEWMWIVTTPVWTILLFAVALELLRGLAQPIPRDMVNRTVALYGFLIGMTVSAVVSLLAHPQAIIRSAYLFLLISRRCILTGCVLAILAQGAYFALGSAPLIRNWRRHRRVLLVFLTALALGSFIPNLGQRQLGDWLNLLRSVTFLSCYCVWIPMFEHAWSHLQGYYYSAFPFPYLSEEAEAEIFAYRARDARHPKTPHALPAAFR